MMISERIKILSNDNQIEHALKVLSQRTQPCVTSSGIDPGSAIFQFLTGPLYTNQTIYDLEF